LIDLDSRWLAIFLSQLRPANGTSFWVSHPNLNSIIDFLLNEKGLWPPSKIQPFRILISSFSQSQVAHFAGELLLIG
jgi:hypothetical protein